MMRFGLSKSYVRTLKKRIVPEGGMALAGGAAGGLAFGLIQRSEMYSKLLVPKDGPMTAKRAMAKKLGLAAVIGLGGGSALWVAGGKSGVDAAKGLMGAMGATMAAVVWNHMNEDAAKHYQLQGTRVHQGELPHGIAGNLAAVNVRSASEHRNAMSPAALMSVLAG